MTVTDPFGLNSRLAVNLFTIVMLATSFLLWDDIKSRANGKDSSKFYRLNIGRVSIIYLWTTVLTIDIPFTRCHGRCGNDIIWTSPTPSSVAVGISPVSIMFWFSSKQTDNNNLEITHWYILLCPFVKLCSCLFGEQKLLTFHCISTKAHLYQFA